MLESALTILIEDRARGADLYINHRQVMSEAVVYLARQSVALSRGRQLFDLGSVISQKLIRLCQCRPRLPLACRDSSEDYNEHDTGAVDHRYRNRVNPPAA